jgi:hypothetical protein
MSIRCLANPVPPRQATILARSKQQQQQRYRYGPESYRENEENS